MFDAPTPDTTVPPSSRYRSGDVIAEKYRLLDEVGRGGMGTVWLARNRLLEIDVAVKLIDIGRSGDQDVLVRRVLQEARTSARLAHPAIARVFDYGQTTLGDPFIVSEFLRGESLEARLERSGAMDPIEAVRMLLPIADALTAAHAEDIVHRDVKSGNIFLSRDNHGKIQPKLLDFGVANFVSDKVKITHVGALLGTPGYMPPEQARGIEVDFRADVWAICVVLYEMLTGQLPFSGTNYNALLYAIINHPPQPLAAHGVNDADLQLLIDHGLRKNPDQRWSAMRELGEALALWLYERGVRVDICGASLRNTWLESGLSELQMDIPDSEHPPEEPASADRGRPMATAAPSIPHHSRPPRDLDHPGFCRPSRDPATTTTPRETRERVTAFHDEPSLFASARSRWLALAAGGLLGAIAIVVLLVRGPRVVQTSPEGSMATTSAATVAPPGETQPTPPPPTTAPPSPSAPTESPDEARDSGPSEDAARPRPPREEGARPASSPGAGK